MSYRFHLACPDCNRTTDLVREERVPAPDVKCGECLMDQIEVVAIKVVKIEEIDEPWWNEEWG
mgnify:CR=1 FL=1